MKRVIVAATTLFRLSICLVGAYAGASAESGTAAAGGYGRPGSFPLQRQLALKGGTTGLSSEHADPNDLPYQRTLERESNVKVTWTMYDDVEKGNIVFAAGDYPDVCFTTGLWSSLITAQAALGVIPDLLPYLGKGDTPNLDALFAKYPDSLAYMLSPDGRLYSLAQIYRVEANYLEQNFMINKVWLDKLRLKVPSTTDELTQVLIAFRDGDPNGNGKKDELPFGFVAKSSSAHLQSLYGIWGIPTKDGPVVRNGKVGYAPLQPEYKEFITFMSGLYAEKLIDVESFTQSQSQFDAKIDSPNGALYGFIIAPKGYTGSPGRNQYVSIEPFKAPGHQPEMWVHPGYLGVKNVFSITKRNPEPEHTLAWFDWLCDFERSMQGRFGPLGEGIVVKDGKWTQNPDKPLAWYQQNTWGGTWPARLLDAEILDKRWIPSASEAFYADNYSKYYKRYLAKEAWNRPEFSGNEIKEVNALRADLDTLWKNKEAEWIVSGKMDAEWEAYMKQMKTMGVDRYVALCQAAYDRFLAGMKKK